jgi:hypothetical protein
MIRGSQFGSLNQGPVGVLNIILAACARLLIRSLRGWKADSICSFVSIAGCDHDRTLPCLKLEREETWIDQFRSGDAVTAANQLFSLKGSVALMTGAAHGLGLAMAEGLAECGATVIVNGRDVAALEARPCSSNSIITPAYFRPIPSRQNFTFIPSCGPQTATTMGSICCGCITNTPCIIGVRKASRFGAGPQR